MQIQSPSSVSNSLPTAMELTDGIQHIGLKIDTEEFLVAVSSVQEIIMLPSITHLPNARTEGIIALRGEIVPVLNLRKVIGLTRAEVTNSTRLLVISSELGPFGIIVDEITDFVWLKNHDLEDVTANFFSSDYLFLNGIAKQGNTARGIIDTQKLLQLVTNFSETAS